MPELTVQDRGAVAVHLGLRDWRRASGLSHLSYHVRDEHGVTVAQHEAMIPRRGASTAKLLTADAALRVLGAGHRFRLELVSDGDALFLRGCHPWVQVPDLRLLTATVHSDAGDLLLDDSRYPSFCLPDGWAPEDVPLNVQPVTPINLREYFGHDPAAAVAEAIAGLLTARGHATRWKGRGLSHGQVVAHVDSPPLLDVAVECLQSSHNVMAEILGRETALSIGLPPSFDSMQATLVDRLEVDTAGVLLMDACGLASQNRVRTDVLTSVLHGWLDDRARPTVPLPIAGVTGTLSAVNGWFQRDPEARLRGYVMAKSGTHHDCLGLAGYTFAPDQPLRVFAILIDGLPGPSPHPAVRRQIEAFVHHVALGQR